jgi:adenine deaminase
MEISGNIVDLIAQEIFPGTVSIGNGRIIGIRRRRGPYAHYILPGFIDAHIHIESSLLTPTEFARLALPHGTVATLSDPHEIANVLGVAGIDFMLANADRSPLKFHFGAPPCVPATPFESAGASLGPTEVEGLLARDAIYFLSEVMNYPGVIAGEPELMAKIRAAQAAGKPIDGHAPGLGGERLDAYLRAGISTDHECVALAEAREKAAKGMHILLRQGSAARDLDALLPMLAEAPDQCMFCSDDLYADELATGHIDALVRRALARGAGLMPVLRAACLNPVRHYRLPVGLLRVGDSADFIVVEDFQQVRVLGTYINGRMVATEGRCLLPPSPVAEALPAMGAQAKSVAEFGVPCQAGEIQVIVAMDGQIVTGCRRLAPLCRSGQVVSDLKRDILKCAVVNRYGDQRPAVGFINGFGLKTGAMASSVAHDSHNILAVGVTDHALCQAINLVIAQGGGLAAVTAAEQICLPLAVAGLMSNHPGEAVVREFTRLNQLVRAMGCPLKAPFMTLSFMALLVIPELKLSDRGLFNSSRMEFTSLFADGF